MRRSLTLLLVLAAVIAAACGTAAPDHVSIGIVAPLTGPRAFLGTEVVNGATLAVEEINRDGGLLGKDVELVVIDDADLVDVPGSLAELAELHRVTAVLGPELPEILLGPRSPLTRRGVPALLPTAFSGDLSTASTFVARTIPGGRVQAHALGSWLRDVRQGTTVAVLVADVVEGGAIADDLLAGLEDAGVEVVDVAQVDGESTNLAPVIARMRDRSPDVDMLLVWGLPTATARATTAVRDLGWDVQLALSASSFASEYRSLVGNLSEGVVLGFPFRESWFNGGAIDQIMLAYYANFGMGVLPQLDTLVLDVPVIAIASHDSVGLIAAAVREAGSRQPAQVAAALETLTWEGLLREYAFDRGETWSVEEIFIARFHELTTVFDVDPRLDLDGQKEFFRLQVTADYVPESLLEGPAGAFLSRLLTRGRQNLATYVAPLPPPGPVSRPADG